MTRLSHVWMDASSSQTDECKQEFEHCKVAVPRPAQALPLLQEDASVTSFTGANEATLHISTSSSMQADLAEVVSMLSSNSVPEALQTAFQVADPDFAAPIAHALQVMCRHSLHKHERVD